MAGKKKQEQEVEKVEPKTQEALAQEAFDAHKHLTKVWVDVAKQEWHTTDRTKSNNKLVLVERGATANATDDAPVDNNAKLKALVDAEKMDEAVELFDSLSDEEKAKVEEDVIGYINLHKEG